MLYDHSVALPHYAQNKLKPLLTQGFWHSWTMGPRGGSNARSIFYNFRSNLIGINLVLHGNRVNNLPKVVILSEKDDSYSTDSEQYVFSLTWKRPMFWSPARSVMGMNGQTAEVLACPTKPTPQTSRFLAPSVRRRHQSLEWKSLEMISVRRPE